MPSEIVMALDALIKSGNADSEPKVLSGGQLNTLDLYPHFQHLFSEKARKTLNNRTAHLVYQYNEVASETPEDKLLFLLMNLGIVDDANYVRKADLVHFFASRATDRNKLVMAIEKVIKSVNTVADLGYTKATLAPLGALRLYSEDPTVEDFVVFSYVTLTDAGKTYAETNMPNMLIREGEVPKKVEDQ